MSGTELGRVMAEATAQPPVDVDLGAVEGLVRRRRRRLGVAAGTGAVAAVVVVVGLSGVLRDGGGDQSRSASLSTGRIPTVKPPWPSHSKEGISWHVPPGWQVRDMQPDLRKIPPGVASPVALLSTFPTGSTCTKPGDPCTVKLPADGVLGYVTVGGGIGLSSAVTTNAGSLGDPDDDCAAMGGGQSFTSSRGFGTEPYTTVVSVTACLGRTAPANTAAVLRLVEASVTDGTAVTVDASWKQMTLGRLSLQVAPDWSVGTAAVSGEMLLDSSCLTNHPDVAAWTCTPTLHPFSAREGVAWVSAVAPPSSPLSKVKYQGSMPATGACAAAGGKYAYVGEQRHLGPQASGELVTVSACLGASAPDAALQELTLMLNSAVDTTYPSAAQLCTAVPGALTSALATVGDMRALKWGTATPGAGLFPKAAASDDSAWCWVRDDADKVFNVWAVHSGDAPVKVVDVGLPWFSWTGPVPSVAPISLVASSFYTLGPSPTPVAPTSISPVSAAATPTLTPAAASGVATGSTAAALCESALGTFATAELDTVADVRTASWGPPAIDASGELVGRLPDAFPGAKAKDAAAWCWTLPAHNIADIYVVHAGDRALLAASINGIDYQPGQVPSGVPPIP